MPFASTPDGIHLYYETVGRGEPLLLVGGRNSDHHIWNLVRRDFAKRYQVIVYDQRGTGQSDKPEQPPYSTRIFARDAVAILDHLQIRRGHAYGISMGGAICQSNQHPMPAYAEALHAHASQEHDAWDLLPDIAAPTLVIHGSDDPVCPSANASLLAERIPGAELYIFYRGRHMFFIEFRRQVNDLILNFLARHPL